MRSLDYAAYASLIDNLETGRETNWCGIWDVRHEYGYRAIQDGPPKT